MLSGTCLCGLVKYEVKSQPTIMNLCHCSMCRKVTGSTYGTFIHIGTNDFDWISGENEITQYESSQDEFRAFCKICGSNVPVIDIDSKSVCIPAGTLDDDPRVKPIVQIFAGSKAPWHDIAKEPIAFDEFEPDDFLDD